MNYKQWLSQVPASVKDDALWNFQVYPKSLLVTDLAWEDCEKLLKDARGIAIAGQLVRSSGSISANIEEGYERGYGEIMLVFWASLWVQLVKLVAGTIGVAAC